MRNKKIIKTLSINIIVSLLLFGCKTIENQLEENLTDISFSDSISQNLILLTNYQSIEDKIQYVHNIAKDKIDSQVNKSEDKVIAINVKDKTVDNSCTLCKHSNNKSIDEQSTTLEKPVKNIQPVHVHSTNDKGIEPDAPKNNKLEIKGEPTKEDRLNKDEIEILCEDAWLDENKPCDYIPDNLKPTDELGRIVAHFFTSQKAWNWGEEQIEDEDSVYGCRGSRMDGYQNDGTQFFFAYLKVCDIN